MVAAQALDIPFTPSFVADEGGVVRPYKLVSMPLMCTKQ